ncbi:hypothetical protein DF150_04595 [Burkholderia cenocepacia]|nr:hypothetical protein DF150_04595 [Burkholderia cenocepacia]
MDERADLDKKHPVEVNARQVKLVGMVKATDFSAEAGSNVQSVLADDGMEPRPDGLHLKSGDGKAICLLRRSLL